MNKAVFLAALLCGAAGCASAREGIGDNLSVEKFMRLVPGRTTRSEVLAMFGRPDVIRRAGEGKEEYTYLQGRSAFGSWYIIPGYLVYNPNAGTAAGGILVIQFDEGVVSRITGSDGRFPFEADVHEGRAGAHRGEENGR